ncbi:MAG: hypothetical protein IJ660_06315 [Alphaproteobacteria bacterium]|nr:hypothetical protein [Alphaproteobacteria bacterium]
MSKKTSSAYNKPIFSLAANATVKISLWRIITEPFKILCINWQMFFMLAIPIAILLTISAISFGRTTLCNISSELSITSSTCSDSPLNFYFNIILCFFILLLFAVKWYQLAIGKNPFSLKSFITLNRGQIKAIGWFCFFTLINLSPLIALIILFLRVPNPIWQQELLFFTSVAWIFLLPLIAIRFYMLIAFALENQTAPSFKTIWDMTAGNMLKLLLGTAVIIFLALCLFMQYYSSVQTVSQISFAVIFATEFEYNILMTLFMALCVNYCYIQKELFFKGAENE